MQRQTVHAALFAGIALVLSASAARAQFTSFERAQLTFSGGTGTEGFGSGYDLQGAWLFVGANGADTVATDAGEVQWFTTGATPTYLGSLFGSDLVASDRFGSAVALDGNRLAVAATSHGHGGVHAGAVYVFAWDGAAWTQEAELLPADGADGDAFGTTLALLGDTLVVGAPTQDAGTNTDEGAVYAYSRASGTWTLVQKLVSTEHATQERFGARLALDGSRLAVGNWYGNGGYPTGTGSVSVWSWNGAAWAFDALLVPPAYAGTNGTFGAGLDLQGDVLAAGQPYGFSPTGHIGVVHVYRLSQGAWSWEAALDPYLIYGGSQLFGEGLELVGDRLVVGASSYSAWGSMTGGMFLFRPTTPGTWAGARVEEILVQSNCPTSLTYLGQQLATDGARAVSRETGIFGRPIVWLYDLLDHVGTDFCFGDGRGTPSPCGNDSLAGADQGCANDTNSRGATLRAGGSASLAADDLWCSILGTGGGNSPMILFGGTARLAGGAGVAFGDGLRCAGGTVQRLGARTAVSTYGIAVYPPGFAARAGWLAGETRYLQAWYRSNSGPCASGYNLTNAVEVTFTP